MFGFVKTLGHLARLVVVATLCAAWSLGSTAGAQESGLADDATYVTTTGVTITWEEPWEVTEEGIATFGDADLVFITNEDALVLVGTGLPAPGPDTSSVLLEAAGADPGSIVTIDEGASGEVSYWLDLTFSNDRPVGAFTLARGDGGPDTTVTMFAAPVAEFAESMASAQADVAIDGEPVFPGVGGDGLQDLLEASASETPDATPEPGANDGGGLSKLDDFGEDAAAGGSWIDPIHGFEVAWVGEWELAERGENTMVLSAADGSVFLNLTGQPSQGASVADYEQFLMDQMSDLGVEIDPAAVYRDEDNLIVAGTLESMPFIHEVIFVDGGDLVISVTVGIDPGEDLEEAIAFYRGSVLIAGVEPLDGWESIDFSGT